LLSAKLSAEVVLVDPLFYTEPSSKWVEYRVIDGDRPGSAYTTADQVYRAQWPDGGYRPPHFGNRAATENSGATNSSREAKLAKLHRIFGALVDRQLVQERLKEQASTSPFIVLEFEGDDQVLNSLKAMDN
jgi:hypothetical protein